MAIKAHLDNPANSESKRGSPRRALLLETSGFIPGADPGATAANVTIHNISATGLLLETALELAEREQLVLDLPEAGKVVAAVVWRSERFYGCAFEEPLSSGALAAAQLQGLAPALASGTAPVPTGTRLRAPTGEALGTQLNRLRREAGLTLAEVAAALGVSKPTVWAWEKGKARPLPERLVAIAAALGVAPEVLTASPTPHEIDGVIAECRARIANTYCIAPEAVRIMVEL